MSRIFWDTNLFIYLFEDYGELSQRVSEVRTRMLSRGDVLLTSALTLGEVLVKPLEVGDTALASRYEDAIVRSATVLAFTRDTSRRYAEIRRDRSVRAPDAVQLACAAAAGVDLFLTNDDRLTNKTVPGVQFVQSISRAFL
jgi:predicted nucleic acid-binding protein